MQIAVNKTNFSKIGARPKLLQHKDSLQVTYLNNIHCHNGHSYIQDYFPVLLSLVTMQVQEETAEDPNVPTVQCSKQFATELVESA